MSKLYTTNWASKVPTRTNRQLISNTAANTEFLSMLLYNSAYLTSAYLRRIFTVSHLFFLLVDRNQLTTHTLLPSAVNHLNGGVRGKLFLRIRCSQIQL